MTREINSGAKNLTSTAAGVKYLAVTKLIHLSRRERQIMDSLFRLGKASAAAVRAAMPDAPSYSAVRTTLRILEEKRVVRHDEQDGKYVYAATIPLDTARTSAVRNLLDTFFDGSAGQAAVALLGSTRKRLTEQEIARLSEIVEKAKRESEQ